MRWLLPTLFLVGACERETILHGLSEPQANAVIVALDAEGIAAASQPDGDPQHPRWRVAVKPAQAMTARQLLAREELPHAAVMGLETLAQDSLVPSVVEEQARWQLALANEVSSTLGTLDGVIAARVHLSGVGGPSVEPSSPSAAVLLKCRRDDRARLEGMSAAIQVLVSRAVTGLKPGSVTVIFTELAPARPRVALSPATRPVLRPMLLSGALLLFIAALVGILLRRRSHP